MPDALALIPSRSVVDADQQIVAWLVARLRARDAGLEQLG